ncbi:SAM hydrolase/SAM-dependent halogenase family protein [Chitinophaga rhizophila]|uniref:S-adenosyl-l-methionine hydroxide adenosyltransferase family protein n=1 Tax=Chitinophaga rhizophila TaxID=2866212 RepID=A0ABS7GJ87_9BACT|nr:S-adenosyl-l-methionine hydroxide adenosyltransferase family protein [Chitinophaga rhizophila]MBW8687441.1 S-adenosyl-l-methionine hydroxide adenosyltransferase family protein [Chitinophaga rhizophila]
MKHVFIFHCLLLVALSGFGQRRALVFQTDFGLKDGAVAEMKGVVYGLSADIPMFDITHEIPAYNIWEAAYRLQQTAPYWPEGTVFVSVVDPGVGSERKSVVLKTRTGHFFVTPDNGTLTLVARQLGIAEVREIDEAVNRRKNSGASYTFHGRDVYAYTGGKLAAGKITFEQVGRRLPDTVVSISFQQPVIAGDTLKGNIPVLDAQYGNVWTNIDQHTFAKLQVKPGDQLQVVIRNADQVVFSGVMPYVNTFAAVQEGKELLYLNSLLNVSFAVNMGDFAARYHVKSGPAWTVTVVRQ